MVVHRVADHFLRATVDDRREVQPTSPGRDIGNVADELFTGCIRDEVAGDEVWHLAGRSLCEVEPLRAWLAGHQADETVVSPTDTAPGTIAEDLQAAAQVLEMLLIKDHSRMKFYATTPYDGTHEQQHKLLPISHPED